MATVKVTLSSLIDDGELDGYKRGLAHPVDDEVCAESDCSYCGRRGPACVAFRSARSYRCFAECPACHHADEF